MNATDKYHEPRNQRAWKIARKELKWHSHLPGTVLVESYSI